MKRLLAFMTVFVLCFTLTCPVFASYSPEPPASWDKSKYPYAVIMTDASGSYYFNACDKPIVVSLKDGKWRASGSSDGSTKREWATWSGSAWVDWGNDGELGSALKLSLTDYPLVWANHHIYDENNSIYLRGDGVECDGSACPATDLDKDNICDDCGQLLTMSLRSTLLEYAINTHVPNGLSLYPNDKYWVITDNTEGGYTILMSNYPFTYSDGVLSTETTIRKSTVITMSTGQNGGRGWSTIGSSTSDFGVPVEASHPIDGFFPIPLWTVVEGVTQGGAMELAEATGGTMTTLTLCGVGLMAFLAVFALFGKRWLIFLR